MFKKAICNICGYNYSSHAHLGGCMTEVCVHTQVVCTLVIRDLSRALCVPECVLLLLLQVVLLLDLLELPL